MIANINLTGLIQRQTQNDILHDILNQMIDYIFNKFLKFDVLQN